MSRRTAEASRAVREAWKREQKLVSEGEGTRDWTEEQQRDILNKGKAYDEDGKAFEGHHMQSAEAYPEYQGDPENIEFLTRKEHQEAHQGNFRNPTNGYYNPETHETTEFGDEKYIPCKQIELSHPIEEAKIQGQEKSKSFSGKEDEETMDALTDEKPLENSARFSKTEDMDESMDGLKDEPSVDENPATSETQGKEANESMDLLTNSAYSEESTNQEKQNNEEDYSY